jgi:hypothetical protein
MFHRKGAHMHFPNSTRQVPMSWNTSNGVFNTKRRGSIYLNFFEYSKSKAFLAEPDIVEYDEKLMESQCMI